MKTGGKKGVAYTLKWRLGRINPPKQDE